MIDEALGERAGQFAVARERRSPTRARKASALMRPAARRQKSRDGRRDSRSRCPIARRQRLGPAVSHFEQRLCARGGRSG